MISGKPKVGLLTLFFDLYLILEDDLLQSSRYFARELVEEMGKFSDVVFPEVCTNREETQKAVKELEAEDVDLIILVLLTYTPSMYALPSLLQTSKPLLLFCTQKMYAVTDDITGRDTDENHGIHGFQDMANTLRRSGRPYHFVTGYWKDPKTLEQVQSWAKAAQVRRILQTASIGLIGHPMENMGDFGVDETAFQTQIGVHVKHLSMQGIAKIAKTAVQSEIDPQMEFDREHFQIEEMVTPEEHESAARIEWAIRETVRQHDLLGFTSHFLAVAEEGWLETLPFLAASKLLGEGFSFGGEGDVTSTAAVAILQLLAGEANFTEMFTMDFGGKTILMSHMGEGNWKMAHPDYPIRLFSTPFDLFPMPVNPVSLIFTLRPGPVTLFNVTFGEEGKLQWIVSEGDIIDAPPLPKLNVVNFRFRPHLPLEEFLTRYGMLGGSHHQAIAYGSHTEELLKLADLLGIKCFTI